MRSAGRFLVVVGMLIGMIMMPLGASADGARFTVGSSEGWQSTGFSVTKGTTVTITVTGGSWSPWPGGDNSGAGKASDVCGIPNCRVPMLSVPVGTLIGKVGGSIFPIGRRVSVVAQDSGTLLLQMNDIAGGYGDNAGSLNVQISTGSTEGAQPSGYAPVNPAGSEPAGNVGGPNLRGYCQSQGYVDDNLARNTADAWSCKMNTGQITSIDMNAACKFGHTSATI